MDKVIPNGGFPPLKYCENNNNDNDNKKKTIKPFAYETNINKQSNLNIRDILLKKKTNFDLNKDVTDELVVINEI
jgi:hypothetical protein